MLLLPAVSFAVPVTDGAGTANKKTTPNSASGCNATDGNCGECQSNPAAKGCNIGCKNGVCTDPAADGDSSCTRNSCDIVQKYINPTINLLSISFGLLATISIILGGIQYAASEGDPQNVTKAKSRIKNTIIAIVAYFFLFAFLQFLIPGGLFNRG